MDDLAKAEREEMERLKRLRDAALPLSLSPELRKRYWPQINDVRCRLVDKEIADGLSEFELILLGTLEGISDAYVRDLMSRGIRLQKLMNDEWEKRDENRD